MMYFVTGATGFIGKRLVRRLLARPGAVVHFLIRDASPERLERLLDDWGVDASRAVAVPGDLTLPGLGIDAAERRKYEGRVAHCFHLAAIYDLGADAESQRQVNVEGTRQVVQFANQIKAGRFHHVSSIAAAGLYEGVFREDMFEQAEGLEHPYFATKHDAEKIVRNECDRPLLVFRPGVVVGDSKTGEMDKIDGPYYFFKLIQRMRQLLPPWMPIIGIEGGRINLVPVDFVVEAMDHIAHASSHASDCYHLVDPEPMRVGDMLNTFAEAAHAPRMTIRVNAALFGFVPKAVTKSLMALTPVRRIRGAIMKDLGLPDGILDFVNYPTRFDCRHTSAALAGTGIGVPRLADYAWALWDYWERHLDPDLQIDRTLRGQVAGRVVLITGGSSGIGLAAARKIAEAGAVTIVCGRDQAKLDEARARVEADGHMLHTFSVDLADMADVDRLLGWLNATHGGVDILVNNAGRSIRRAIESSQERFHDFERCMQLNYFGAIRTTMGVLPGMVAKRRGQVINISSIGVLTNAPRFSAYVASKSALDAWTMCASSEYADLGVRFTTINMPLVRTPMIAPTKLYNNVPTLSAEEAADMIVQAIVHKPARIATRLGITGAVLHATVPRLAQIMMNTTFRMFPDSEAAKGVTGAKAPTLSADQIAFQQLMRGIHF
jgi:NAD(P)-dependent dehydrogenase (short-subunit alcohol dehydrogenase family)